MIALMFNDFIYLTLPLSNRGGVVVVGERVEKERKKMQEKISIFVRGYQYENLGL